MSAKKKTRILAAAVAAYLLVLLALVLAESGSPDSGIRSFGDALWYSVITLTTVGYGDLYPVTPAGKVLGTVLALCSVGVLSALIGLILSLLNGRFLPGLKIRRGRGKTWYVFPEASEDACTLAGELLQEENALCVFLQDKGSAAAILPEAVYYSADMGEVMRLRGGDREGIACFFMGKDEDSNYIAALEAAREGLTTYCMTDLHAGSQEAPKNLHVFSRSECISRSYWKEHPLRDEETDIVLIGCGAVGRALMERALLINVTGRTLPVSYHVFGRQEETEVFVRLHSAITADLTAGTPGEDRLALHTDGWMKERDLLEKAGRIIVCADTEAENLDVLAALRSWYAPQGALHVYCGAQIPGVTAFGGREAIVTKELVIRKALNQQAVKLHEIYSRGAAQPVPWEALSDFLQQSNIAAADHLAVKIRFLLGDGTLTEVTPALCERAYKVYCGLSEPDKERCREMEHRRWMRFHRLYNWAYAPVRDNARRRHPMLLPYRDLSREDQLKDSYAWEMLGEL